jgi:hypothetical protein
MSHLTTHPLRNLAVLLVVAFALFMLSASGQENTFWSSGPSWLGAIGWFGFLLTALAFIVYGLFVLVRLATRSRRTA